VSGQLHTPASLPPGKEAPVPIGEEAGWASEPVRTTWRRKNSWPYRDSNSDPSVIQPVASCYTDYAIPAPLYTIYVRINTRTPASVSKHEVFFAQSNSILAISSQSLSAAISRTRPISWKLTNSKELFFSRTVSTSDNILERLSLSFYNPSARTRQKTQPLLLRKRVYWSVA
jgi:hypothetical protein